MLAPRAHATYCVALGAPGSPFGIEHYVTLDCCRQACVLRREAE